MYNDLTENVKLLKCKYLNCDPEIDIYSEDDTDMYDFEQLDDMEEV